MPDFMRQIDAVFVGRKTYEMSLGIDANTSGMPQIEEYIFPTRRADMFINESENSERSSSFCLANITRSWQTPFSAYI